MLRGSACHCDSAATAHGACSLPLLRRQQMCFSTYCCVCNVPVACTMCAVRQCCSSVLAVVQDLHAMQQCSAPMRSATPSGCGFLQCDLHNRLFCDDSVARMAWQSPQVGAAQCMCTARRCEPPVGAMDMSGYGLYAICLRRRSL
jgi:hypothetical protein